MYIPLHKYVIPITQKDNHTIIHVFLNCSTNLSSKLHGKINIQFYDWTNPQMSFFQITKRKDKYAIIWLGCSKNLSSKLQKKDKYAIIWLNCSTNVFFISNYTKR